MRSCLFRPESRDQGLLGNPLSIFLEPQACTVSLCDSLHVGLPHALADTTQFEHNFHHARSVEPPIDR